MKNPATYLRQSLYTLLNNNVVYNATPVPVFENEGQAGLPYQINIMDYSDTDNSTRSSFGATARQVIEIVAEQPTSARMAVDQIGELVMELISPHPENVSTLSSAQLEVFTQEKPSQNYITDTTANGHTKIVRLILGYNLLITQKNN